MEELQSITERYQPEYIGESFSSLEGVNRFALTFYKDVAEIYDCLTRLKNIGNCIVDKARVDSHVRTA